jgi:hypothetical protein
VLKLALVSLSLSGLKQKFLDKGMVQVQASIMERDSMYKRLKHLRYCLADVATASDITCTGILSELPLSAQGIMVAPTGRMKHFLLDPPLLAAVQSWLKKEQSMVYDAALQ